MALYVSTPSIAYPDAWQIQRDLVAARAAGIIGDVIWLLEHPPVYTFGRHGKRTDLYIDDATLERIGATCVHSDRGGQMTWHGPGQTTGYVIADVRKLGGPRGFVEGLVDAMVDASGLPNATADHDRMGVYVNGRKLGSVGIRITGGISYHGIAFNRDPDLIWYERMSACGQPDVPATSLTAEGLAADRTVYDARLAHALATRLGLGALQPTELDELMRRADRSTD